MSHSWHRLFWKGHWKFCDLTLLICYGDSTKRRLKIVAPANLLQSKQSDSESYIVYEIRRQYYRKKSTWMMISFGSCFELSSRQIIGPSSPSSSNTFMYDSTPRIRTFMTRPTKKYWIGMTENLYCGKDDEVRILRDNFFNTFWRP